MPEEANPYAGQYFGEMNTKIRDLEERQRVLRDRLVLIGQNFIEIKERTDEKIISMKKDIELLKQNMERITSFIESASAEFSKFAKKDDLEILYKQAKMFNALK